MNLERNVFAMVLSVLLLQPGLAAGIETIEPDLSSASTPLVISPPEPTAHEPFTVEIYVGCSPSIYPRQVEMSLADDTLEIAWIGGPVWDCGGGRSPSALRVTVDALPYGDFTIRAYKDNIDYPSDYLLETMISVSAAPGTVTAYNYYHPDIDHYFTTASFSEGSMVELFGWQPLGRNGFFRVWPADGEAPSSARPVCRFYSSFVNSHFYTAGEQECESLKAPDTDWEYEGIAFQALVPEGGACPLGSSPVYRLFNDRADIQDSNHRFVTSPALYRGLIEDGWIGEGAAFCEPAVVPSDCVSFGGFPVCDE